jgi:DNA-binding beta-propeller fold protein YncE
VLYFADVFVPDFSHGSIRIVGLDGSGLDTVLQTGGGLRDVDLDLVNGKMYWVDVDNFVIRRANLDGSGQEDIVTSGLEFPSAIAVDPVGGKIYWGDQSAFELRRANLDGTNNELLRSTAFHRGIALDTVNGKVYWSTSETLLKGKILRCNLDGPQLETVVESLDPEFKPAAIALDIAGGKVYWTDYVVDVVRRANLDGTNIDSLYTVGANHNPRGIELDLAAGKVYWGQDDDFKGTTGKIMRMDLDGFSPQPVIENLGLVNALVLGPEVDLCAADLVPPGGGDFTVGPGDLAELLAQWGDCPPPSLQGGACPADIAPPKSPDGVVGPADLAELLAHWGACGP